MSRKHWMPVLGLAIIAAPLLMPTYLLSVATVVLCNVTYAAALFVITRMGYLSFGHAGFILIGAYTSAVLATQFGVSPWVGFVLAGLLAGLSAWALGAVTLKLRGIYFSMGVFAFAEVVGALLRSWSYVGGPAGIADIPRPSLFGRSLDGYLDYFYVVLAVSGGALIFLYRLQSTPFGFTLLALRTRETEALARSIGINVKLYKALALCLSATICGVMGAVNAHYLQFVSPFVFNFMTSMDLVIFVMVGGVSNFMGPILGAGALTIVGELLFSVGYYKSLIYAIVLLVVILVVPGGLVELPGTFLRRIRSLRAAPTAAAQPGTDPSST